MNWRRFLWVALLASLGVMLATQYLQKNAKKPEATPAPVSAVPAPVASSSPASAPAGAAKVLAAAPSSAPVEAVWQNQLYKPQSVTLGGLDKNGWKVEVQLTNEGAAVEGLHLSEYFVTVRDKKVHAKDPAGYQEALKKDPKLKGYYQVLQPVYTASGAAMLPLTTQKLHLPKEGLNFDLSGRRWDAEPVQNVEKGQAVTFTSQLLRDGKPYLVLKKTYTLQPESYSLQVRLSAENASGEKVQCDLTQLGAMGLPREDVQNDKRSLAWAQQIKGEAKVSLEDLAKDSGVPTWPAIHDLGLSESAEPILWVGQTNKFFGAMLYLVPTTQGLLADPEAKATFFDAAIEEKSGGKAYLSGVKLGPYDLDAGSQTTIDMDVYAGPKKIDLLEAGRYGALRYVDVVEITSQCTSSWLTRGMIWLLNIFSKVTFGNYGLAIILLVVCVRLALHPLTKKSQISMSKMQTLQPELARIREKYKDDKAKLNSEMMQLYKQGGATPILGCLPMLLQMPIWVALYSALSASVELRHAGFLPIWITDLAAPDALIPFAHAIQVPLVGWTVTSFNLLPILLTIAMILQQKFTPTTSASMDDAQAKQQKQMMYFMNGFFLLIFYNAPSGLTLYIMASTFAGVAEQYVIRRHIQQAKEAALASTTTVVIGGKASRLSRPKKPKGPFRG